MRIEFLLAIGNAKTSVSRRLVLVTDRCAVGRQDGDLRLSDPLVSRMHAVIYFDEGGLLKIKDLDSTNGTWVNDERIIEKLLHKGDEVRIGETAIILVRAEPHQGRSESATELPAMANAGEGDERLTAEHPAMTRTRERSENLSYLPRKAAAQIPSELVKVGDQEEE